MKLGKTWGLIPLFLFTFLFAGFFHAQDSQQSWPEASRHLANIPLYEKYADLAPLFQFDNDTTYVINFWATWCKPCIEELPYFEALQDKYHEQKLRVILVSLDFPRQLESQLLPFLEKQKLASTVLVLLDGKYNEWIDKLSPDWSGAIPASLIYRRKQKQFIPDAFDDLAELEDAVNKIHEH
ncbi:MAG: TlpA family protein disulfide reductase [Bacteroidota bacterium]